MKGTTAKVLGPRDGPQETLPNNRDPRAEYVTGVLAPRESNEPHDIDAEADPIEVEGDTEGEEDQEGPLSAAGPALSFSPALNPRALPHSIGISFVVENRLNASHSEVCEIRACRRITSHKPVRALQVGG